MGSERENEGISKAEGSSLNLHFLNLSIHGIWVEYRCK